jgi:HPt (histidine-containing phosphotransfer) domain-containing protein
VSTEAQINANRENAKLSTGPLSPEGKQASSQNATRHGLATRGLIILPGQQDAFDKLESDLRQSLTPNGPLQELIFKRALASAWNLHRCEQAEQHIYQVEQNPTRDPLLGDYDQIVRRVHRYARESENSLYKAMRELGKLQTEAEFRKQQDTPSPEETVSELCDTQQVRKTIAKQQPQPANRNEPKIVTPNRIEANPAAPPVPLAA